jgi:two-component system, NarL family, response regulator NreC
MEMKTPATPKSRILLIDDHAVLRSGMRHLIEAEPDMEVVGEGDDGAAVPGLVEQLRPDIVVLDLSMPKVGGAEAVRSLKAAGAECKVLVLTVQEDRSYVRELLEAGALGYMLKRAAAEELIQAIRAIAAGSVYVDSRLASKLISSLVEKGPAVLALRERLTAREEDVLRLIAEGFSIKEIAGMMEISVKTVETYKARASEKLGLRSRVDIVRVARQQGWLGKLDAG